MLEHINLDADPGAIVRQMVAAAPHSFTFFKGEIGKWKGVFGPHHVELFESRFGSLLDAYGYES